MSSALDSTNRRGGKNMWGSSLSFSFTLSIVYKLSFKRTSIKTSEEGGLITFSFDFPFPLEIIFHLPPSTYVSTKLTRANGETKETYIMNLFTLAFRNIILKWDQFFWENIMIMHSLSWSRHFISTFGW